MLVFLHALIVLNAVKSFDAFDDSLLNYCNVLLKYFERPILVYNEYDRHVYNNKTKFKIA